MPRITSQHLLERVSKVPPNGRNLIKSTFQKYILKLGQISGKRRKISHHQMQAVHGGGLGVSGLVKLLLLYFFEWP